MTIWHELGIAPTRELRDIKRAYAAKLKITHPEDNPEAFQQLRAAYERALAMAGGPEQSAARLVATQPEQPVSATPDSAAVERQEPDRPELPHPYAAAQQLCAQLESTPARQRLSTLKAELAKPGWEQLDFQAALQRAVLHELSANFERYFDVASIFASAYGWEEALQHARHADPVLVELWHRRDARRWCAAIDASQLASERPLQTALLLLRRAPDESRFKGFARRGKNLRAMRQLLDELQTRRRAVAQFEINRGAAQWWWQHLGKQPLAVDTAIGLFALGLLLVGPLSVGLIVLLLEAAGFDPKQLRWLSVAVFVLGALAPLGIDAGIRKWKRQVHRGAMPSLRLLRERWLLEPRRRRAVTALATLCVIAALAVPLSPWFFLTTALGFCILGLWYGLQYAAMAMAIFVWPLFSMLNMASAILLAKLNLQIFPSGTRFEAFAHLLGAFLFAPLAKLCGWIWLKLTAKPVENPTRWAFILTLLSSWAVFAALGDQVPPRLSQRSVTEPPQIAVRPLSPAPRTARPLSDVEALAPEQKKLVDAAYARFFDTRKPAPSGAQLRISFTVSADGSVSEANVLVSTFKHPAFEAALLDATRGVKYPANNGYWPTNFIYEFKEPDKDRMRPLSEIQAMSSLIQDRIKVAQREAYGTAQPPPGAKLTVRYSVAPDGSVSEASIESSSFDNPAFERAAVAAVKALMFSDNPGYLASTFTFQYGDMRSEKERAAAPKQRQIPRPLVDVFASSSEISTQLSRIRGLFRIRASLDALPRMSVAFTVGSDGSISEAAVKSSTYGSQPFAERIVYEFSKFRFSPNSAYRPTRFTLTLSDADAAGTQLSAKLE